MPKDSTFKVPVVCTCHAINAKTYITRTRQATILIGNNGVISLGHELQASRSICCSQFFILFFLLFQIAHFRVPA